MSSMSEEEELRSTIEELRLQLSYEKERNSFLQAKIEITVKKSHQLRHQLQNITQLSNLILKSNEEPFHPSLPLN